MTNWKEENNKLTKTFLFKTFGETIAWMVKASFEIEKLNHYTNLQPMWWRENLEKSDKIL